MIQDFFPTDRNNPTDKAKSKKRKEKREKRKENDGRLTFDFFCLPFALSVGSFLSVGDSFSDA
jgi:hypothetical protein